MEQAEPRFGTDGIRGVANEELTAELALKLGIAAAYVLGKHSTDRHVVVGRDTRLSGDMLGAALSAGLQLITLQGLHLSIKDSTDPCKLTITNINSSYVEGHFSGTVVGQSRKKMTNGKFKIYFD